VFFADYFARKSVQGAAGKHATAVAWVFEEFLAMPDSSSV
jgi:hypothetical protein